MSRWRRQIQLANPCLGRIQVSQTAHQVLLPRLPEGEPVHRQRLFQFPVVRLLPAEGRELQQVLDLRRRLRIVEDPVRVEVREASRSAVPGGLEEAVPRVPLAPPTQRLGAETACDVLPHRVAVVTVYPPRPLLHVHGVAGQVPVPNPVAVAVEV